MITVKNLAELGYEPAPWWGEALSLLNPEPWEDPFEATEEMIRVVCDKLKNDIRGKYVIVDLRNMDYMKNKDGEINLYNTEKEACTVCGMYEFENAWVMKLIFNHIEK